MESRRNGPQLSSRYDDDDDDDVLNTNRTRSSSLAQR